MKRPLICRIPHRRRFAVAALATLGVFAALLAPACLLAQTTVDNAITPTVGTVNTTGNNLTLTGTATGTIDTVSGSGTLTKTGTGTWTFSNVNTYTGATTINAGTLQLSGSGSLYSGGSAAGTITVNSGGVLSLQRSDTFGDAFTTPVATVTINAGGLVTNAGGNSFNTLNNLTLNGGTLHADGGVAAAFPAFQLKGTVTVGGSSTSQITTTGATHSGIQLGNNTAGGVTTFNVADATGSALSDLTISAVLQNGVNGSSVPVASGLAKTGAGTLLLSGANTYTGGTTVSGGTLTMGAAAALGTGGAVAIASGATLDTASHGFDLTRVSGSGTLTGASGTLTYNSAASQSLATALAGNVSLTKSGSGALTLGSNANTLSGPTTISGGTLQFSGGAGLPSSAVTLDSGGTIRVDNFSTARVGSLSGSGALSFEYGALRVGGNNASTTFSGSLAGSGTLVKTGSGTLTFTGSSTGGELAVSGGSLVFSPSSSANYQGPVIAQSGGSVTVSPLDPSRFIRHVTVQNGGSATIALPNSTPLATTDITVYSGGSLTMGSTHLTTALSNTTLIAASGANLSLPGEGMVLGGFQNFSGGAVTITPTGFWVVPGFQVGANNISSYFGGTLVFTGSSYAPNIVKVGTGTWTLLSTPNFAPVVQAGYVALADSNAAGTGIQLRGGGLRYDTSMTHTGSISAQTNGGTLDTGANNVTLAGTLGGGSFTPGVDTLTKIGAGTLTLTANNGSSSPFFGTLAINGGTVSVANNGNLGYDQPGHASSVYFGGGTLRTTASFTSGHPITLNSGGGTLEVNPGTTLTWNGAITGASGNSLTKTGTGTLVLGGTNTYAGATTINANSGTLSIGAGGTTGTLGSSSVAIGSGSTLRFDRSDAVSYSGTLSGSGALQKHGAGTLTLSGASTGFGGATTIAFGTVIPTHASALGTGAVSVSGNTARLNLSGTALANVVALTSGGLLTGTGRVGALTVGSGGIVSPGNSPGTVFADGASTFAAGGSYTWEIANATGVSGTHYDLLSISGGLTIGASSGSGNTFTINLTSLNGSAAGQAANFNATSNYSFTFVTVTSGSISGFDASDFTLNTSGFTNPFTPGGWSIAQNGNTLVLHYTGASAIPEPSTYAAITGAAMLAFAAWRRRQIAARSA